MIAHVYTRTVADRGRYSLNFCVTFLRQIIRCLCSTISKILPWLSQQHPFISSHIIINLWAQKYPQSRRKAISKLGKMHISPRVTLDITVWITYILPHTTLLDNTLYQFSSKTPTEEPSLQEQHKEGLSWTTVPVVTDLPEGKFCLILIPQDLSRSQNEKAYSMH